MKKGQRIFSTIIAVVLCISMIGMLVGCGKTGSPSGDNATTGNATTGTSTTGGDTAKTPDTSKEVKLIYYLWGGEGVANKDILNEINKKLKADINATLEVKYIDWGDIATKYPLLFASGEKFDMSHASPNAVVSYYTLAAEGSLVDITDMLDSAAPKLKAEIPESTWAGSKFNGRIYGVPTLYSEYTPAGFVYRTDLLKKYGLEPVTSIETMTAYMDKVLENEKFPPLNGTANLAQDLYDMFVDLTGQWIEAPGIPSNQLYLVATSPDNYTDIIHPAFTEEFENWVVMMREWADKGYWPKDVLSAQIDDKDNALNGLSGAFITHMTDWTGNYGAFKEKLPDADTDFWTFAEASGKIKRKQGVENSTVISVTSENPERALMAIEKFMTDESYYRLIQYGIEGRQYEIVNGVAQKPANFNPDVDSGGFSAWALRNDKFNIPYASEDPRRYELIEKWNKTAINDPFMGFSFDSTKLSTQLSSVANVDSQLGIQLMLGKTTDDPKTAVQKYRDQLKKAGVDDIINELKAQLANHKPVK